MFQGFKGSGKSWSLLSCEVYTKIIVNFTAVLRIYCKAAPRFLEMIRLNKDNEERHNIV
jgi:hypothetical protein